jgi:hypothetical protein
MSKILRSEPMPNYIRAFLSKYGSIPISYISVCRVPLNGAVEFLANVVSAGKYEAEKANRNIDRFFHLFMLIGLSNGRRIVFEKNQRITLFETYKQFSPTEANCINTPPVPNGLTFRQFIKNGIRYAGVDNYFVYDAFSNNCQMFVKMNLVPNRLWTKRVAQFTMQPVERLVPKWTEKLTKGVTNLAARVEKLTGYRPPKDKIEGDTIEHPILTSRREQEEAEEHRDELLLES